MRGGHQVQHAVAVEQRRWVNLAALRRGCHIGIGVAVEDCFRSGVARAQRVAGPLAARDERVGRFDDAQRSSSSSTSTAGRRSRLTGLTSPLAMSSTPTPPPSTKHRARVTTGHVLGIGLGQEDGYVVALSRGRAANRLYLVEGLAPGDPELALPDQQTRGAYEQAAETLGTSRASGSRLTAPRGGPTPTSSQRSCRTLPGCSASGPHRTPPACRHCTPRSPASRSKSSTPANTSAASASNTASSDAATRSGRSSPTGSTDRPVPSAGWRRS